MPAEYHGTFPEGKAMRQGGLSLLLPTYNDICVSTVSKLSAAMESLPFDCEIIVADDASTDIHVKEANRHIATLPFCSYIEREENAGRAAIRNFLARKARFVWLLFIDADMEIADASKFIMSYMESEGDIVYGGYHIAPAAEVPPCNLRLRYELSREGTHSAAMRRRHPNADFHTSNFLISRAIMLAHPLNERFHQYGFEDVAYGKSLLQAGYTISHEDIPTEFTKFESNRVFIEKTETSLHTLLDFKDELRGVSRLEAVSARISKLHADFLFSGLYRLLGRRWRSRLVGDCPSLRLFGLYKLCYFIHLRSSR